MTKKTDIPFDSVHDGNIRNEERKASYVNVADIDDKEDGNPRKITRSNLERLKQSIQDNSSFFEARPILLNRADGRLKIIGGHQRLKAAKSLGNKNGEYITNKYGFSI